MSNGRGRRYRYDKRRTCLKCEDRFRSTGIGNRLCDKCRISNGRYKDDPTVVKAIAW